MKLKFNLIALTLVLIFFVSCSNSNKNDNKGTKNDETEQLKHNDSKKDSKNVHWSHHKGEDGPENWKNLCDDFADCGGNSQSPINIDNNSIFKVNDLVTAVFNYGKSKVNIINNGHTVQFNIDGENNVNLNGKNYKLLQFHYHALSEHTIDGKHFPIEVHFVHKHSDTDYAVIGVMYVEGKENKLLKKYLDKIPTSKGDFKSNDTIDILEILPDNKSYYYYNGSLTTPPCTEIVNWYILKNPLEASKEQIEKFSEILHNNYRPVQPINGRKVKQYLEK